MVPCTQLDWGLRYAARHSWLCYVHGIAGTSGTPNGGSTTTTARPTASTPTAAEPALDAAYESHAQARRDRYTVRLAYQRNVSRGGCASCPSA